MIEFLSSWAKSLGLAIVAVSILEMLLPNNKTKKYIRMVMGIYVIFSILSPIINNKEIFNLENINFENYSTQASSVVNQTSMNERIENLYIQEMEKDITKKLKEKGFEVTNCNVSAKIAENQEQNTEITKIKLSVKKINISENATQEPLKESSNEENNITTEIKKIDTVNIEIGENKGEENNNNESDLAEENINQNENNKQELKLTKKNLEEIKKFLMEEYEVSEKCLEIN